MRQPSDKAIRDAVIAWTKAELRWMECALAQVGTDAFRRLAPEFHKRKARQVKATATLTAMGCRMLNGQKAKK